jgi:hypothetical protein
MKSAHVIQRAGKLFVHTLSRTTAGVVIGSDDVAILREDTKDSDLGEAVLRALRESKEQIPHPMPADWPDINRRYLAALQTKSLSAFMKGALCVGVSSDEDRIIFEPTKNSGSRDGFLELRESRFELVGPLNADEIGLCVRRALRMSL